MDDDNFRFLFCRSYSNYASFCFFPFTSEYNYKTTGHKITKEDKNTNGYWYNKYVPYSLYSAPRALFEL